MSSIYGLFNDTKVDLSEYKACELNDMEKQKWKRTFRKTLKAGALDPNRPFMINGKTTVAAVVVLSIVLISTFMGNGVLANINLIRTGIEEFLHYNANSLADYKTVINKEISKNGAIVKLNEVILDDDQIIISSTFSSDKIKWDQSTFVDVEVYINGKDIMRKGGGGSSEARVIDDETCSFLITKMPNDEELISISGNLNIKVIYNKIRTGNVEIGGRWAFEFTSDRNKLSEDIITIPVRKEFAVENGPKIKIESLKISPVALKLIYSQTDYMNFYTGFIVKDQNGEELKIISGHNYNENGTYMFSALDKKVTSLRITPVLSAVSRPAEGSGKETVEYRKVLESESFEVVLK